MATEVDARLELQRFCKQYPTVKAAAEVLGARPNYVGEVLKGRRDVPASILDRLGLRRAVVKKDVTKKGDKK